MRHPSPALSARAPPWAPPPLATATFAAFASKYDTVVTHSKAPPPRAEESDDDEGATCRHGHERVGEFLVCAQQSTSGSEYHDAVAAAVAEYQQCVTPASLQARRRSSRSPGGGGGGGGRP